MDVPFSKGGSGAAPVPHSSIMASSPAEASMNADVRLRTRMDMDNVHVPRNDLSTMVFFERRRRDEGEKTYLLKTRIHDDPSIVQNKPFPLFPTSYRLPMQCTRLACPGKRNDLGSAAPAQLIAPIAKAPADPQSLPFVGAKPTKPSL